MQQRKSSSTRVLFAKHWKRNYALVDEPAKGVGCCCVCGREQGWNSKKMKHWERKTRNVIVLREEIMQMMNPCLFKYLNEQLSEISSWISRLDHKGHLSLWHNMCRHVHTFSSWRKLGSVSLLVNLFILSFTRSSLTSLLTQNGKFVSPEHSNFYISLLTNSASFLDSYQNRQGKLALCTFVWKILWAYLFSLSYFRVTVKSVSCN